jgi:hypothetical protein
MMKAAWAMAVVAVAAGSAQAAVAVDDFSDANRTDAPSATDLQWFTRQNAGLAVNSTAPTIDGSALKVNWTTNFGVIVGNFDNGSGLSVDDINDQIKVSFDISFQSGATGELRFGIYNRNNNIHSADGSTSSDNDFGYRVVLTPTGAASGSSFTQETGADSRVTNGNDGNGVITNSAPGSGYSSLGTATHSVELTVTRTGASQVTLAWYLDDVLMRTATDTGNLRSAGQANTEPTTNQYYDTFHLLAFGSGGSNSHFNSTNEFALDNVRIETAIVPEPATLFLLGLSGLACLRRRRA